MDEWVVYRFWNNSMGAEMYARHKYVSLVNNLELEDGTFVSDSDVFVDLLKDYLKGDTDKDGYIETALGEVADFDGDGVEPYDPETGAYDMDDWGLVDKVDHFSHVNTQTPGGTACVFDNGFDGRIDIDLNCPCPDYGWDPNSCQTSLLTVDGTDLDNQGHFDGLDVNEDGDLNDWVSVDELVSLSQGDLSDDTLRDHLAALNVGYVAVFMEPCFSGGFVEDLSGANTVIMTATVEEALSWGNIFVRNFTDAVDDPALSDVNGDGLVSMAEAFNYAALNDPYDEVPQYDDSGDALSTPFFIPENGDGGLGNFLFIGSSPSCGNGLCEGPMGEDCTNCPADCASAQAAICGDGACNGSQYGETGETCPADCPIDILPGGGTCGDCQKGRCDGVCNSRKEDSSCADCNPGTGYNCGDGLCDTGEDDVLCPVDCGTPPPLPGTCCGDDVCEGDETVADCLTDCACSGEADCAWIDDSNECTTDTCLAGICQNIPLPDNTPCAIGVCNSGVCEPVDCSSDADCDDGVTCTADTCFNPGTIWAYCRSDWPGCGLPDGCCGPSCGVEDPDCQATCDACWKGSCDGICNDRKEGPDCADCQ